MQDMRGMWKGIIWRSPQGYSYNDWFYSRQRPTRRELELQRRASFDIEPVFSIIVPLFKTPISFFYDMVGSVVAQTYGKWELLLVNASPEDAELGEAVRQVCAADKRIKSILLDGNYGITLNTRAGMEAATGDFLSFFDHDDVLEPDCLYEYVKGINAYPDTDLLYCDEDKLLDGKYLDAFMKPDLDREMLTCCNYICHMLTVRKSVVDALPELPGKDSDGAQDYDLTLSVVERARNVYHARKALYHWRIHSGSTASHPDAKPWAEDAGRRVLQRYYDRIGLKAKAVVNREMDNLYHVDYETPADALVSIVIPNKDAADVLARCIDSIFARTTHRAFEIVIVENNSTDPATFDYYDKLTAEHPEVRVVTYEGEFNYSAINNLGVRYTKGDYLLFLNNDVEVIEPRWLELLMGPFMRGGVGIVGAKLFYPSKLIQHAGVIIPQAGPTHVSRLIPSSEGGYLNIPFAMSSQYLAVTGACAMTKREYFDAVSGFDETLPVAYNDVDFCLRIRELGLACVLEVRAQLYHYESVTRGHDGRSKEKLTRLTADQGRMMERWPEYYACGDPYYNWNCEPGTELYQLRW
jgi:GT2 family glycosyltransferase